MATPRADYGVTVDANGVIYAVGEDADSSSTSLRAALAKDYNWLQGICIILFMLIMLASCG